MDSEIRERQVRICKALANSTRLRMLGLLGRREWPVSQVLAKIGISKANLSQQLAVLKRAGIVRTRREGRIIYCSLAIPEVKRAEREESRRYFAKPGEAEWGC
jgi:DNA-binding transcriptional ArsR family regulator